MSHTPSTMRSSRPTGWFEPDGWVRWLQSATDLGLAATLFVAPLLMGGRHPIGQFVFVTIVALTTLAWCLSQSLERSQIRWTWSGAEIIALCAVVLVIMQLIPFSATWLARLSPHLAEFLPLWSGGEVGTRPWPGWHLVSLSPDSTRGGLSILVAYTCLFFVTAQRLCDRRDIERLLCAVALAGIAMAGLGMAQYLFGNGKFVWIYAHPSRDTFFAVKGTFANQNHFGHFIALTIAPALWWLHRENKSNDERGAFGSRHPLGGRANRRRVFLIFGVGLMLLSATLTFSRGGIMAVMLATSVFAGYLAAKKELERKAVVGIAVIMCVIGAAVTLHGHSVLREELSTLTSQDLNAIDASRGRRRIWSAVTRAIPHFVYLGSGIGSHRDVYPTFMDEVADVEYTHAENGYLQILLEAGGAGLCLLLSGIALSGLWLWRCLVAPERPRRAKGTSNAAGAILASWLVSILHATADFHWYIPACMSLTLMLLAAAMRLDALERPLPKNSRDIYIPRLQWGMAVLSIAVVSALTIHERWASAAASIGWDEYLARSLVATRIESGDGSRTGRQRFVSDVDRSSPEALSGMISQLDKSLRHNPRDARAHLRLSALCLRQFELLQTSADNAMPLSAIRDAANAGGFTDHAEMIAWIRKAVGPNVQLLDDALTHAKAAVWLCPLQGLGYVYLSEVAFLSDGGLPAEHQLLSQAYRVRPYDGSVLFANGQERLLRNDISGALAFWKEAFRRGPRLRRQVLETVGDQLTAEELMSMFQPNLEGMSDILDYFRETQQLEKARVLLPILSDRLREEANLLSLAEVAGYWTQIQFAFQLLGEYELSARAASYAVQAVPDEFTYRQTYAYRLRKAGQLADALEQFRWLRSRQPDNPHFAEAMANILRSQQSDGNVTATRQSEIAR